MDTIGVASGKGNDIDTTSRGAGMLCNDLLIEGNKGRGTAVTQPIPL